MTTPARRRVAVLISGRGSNLAALIAACAAPGYPAEIVRVVSNRPDAAGLRLAAVAGIPGEVIDHAAFASRADFEASLNAALRDASVEMICLAGFMRVLGPGFVEDWRDRMINIHPSLLPVLPGLDTHVRALATGAPRHGATVHFVRAQTDSGPIIVQGVVPVLAGDTPETLGGRVLAVEHRIYPLALKLVASGIARVAAERVSIPDYVKAAEPDLLWPDELAA